MVMVTMVKGKSGCIVLLRSNEENLRVVWGLVR